MIRFGVIGYGYWGPNLLRNLSGHPQIELAALADARPQRLEAALVRYRHLRVTENAMELIDDPAIDAIAIATPPSSHAPLAIASLERDKHVIVTKPLASTVEDARAVAEAASRSRGVLLVDNTFVYTGAVRKLHELVEWGTIGRPCYYDSMRVNLGIHQADVSVVWDLAPHDLSILDYLTGEQPAQLVATSRRIFGSQDDMAQIMLDYDSGFTAHLNLSWVSPVKIRMIVLGGTERFAVYDDMETSEKIKVYDSSVEELRETMAGEEERHRALVQYRIGDIYTPKIDQAEALQVEVDHFVQCVNGHASPLTDLESGLRQVLVLDAIERSIAEGVRVKVLPS